MFATAFDRDFVDTRGAFNRRLVVKPSVALDMHRETIRAIVLAHRGLNPRVFGSVLRQEDTHMSDLDILIDAADGMTLFDMAAIAAAIENLTQIKVDLRTPGDLSARFRARIVAEAEAL